MSMAATAMSSAAKSLTVISSQLGYENDLFDISGDDEHDWMTQGYNFSPAREQSPELEPSPYVIFANNKPSDSRGSDGTNAELNGSDFVFETPRTAGSAEIIPNLGHRGFGSISTSSRPNTSSPSIMKYESNEPIKVNTEDLPPHPQVECLSDTVTQTTNPPDPHSEQI
ncbi:hypothetical protein BDV93DRAFT_527829 [Ceratobasidium sp. AG-I]|nr:hypothetical protein BDV93DRAFT_527829 [Ceratobasidium sp. AG-I]